MPATSLTGSRIREKRLALKMRQAELARQAGISASYLNLIEHNRRRIAGKLLFDIARALEVDASSLTQGAEHSLIEGLQTAAAESSAHDFDLSSAEDIAGRHPEWARLIGEQRARITLLEYTVSTLTDRLAHDPFLTNALHNVISSVTSIRSSSSILIAENDIDPDWQQRFQQNIFNDSRRLAENAQSLASYLDGATGETVSAGTPMDDCFAAIEAASHHFAPLEASDADLSGIDSIVENTALSTDAARALFHKFLTEYLADAQAMPMADLPGDMSAVCADPVRYAQDTGLPLALVLRRLARLPRDVVGTQIGMVQCDGAGALIARKPIKGFDIPRVGSACPLWPLYSIAGRAGMPMRSYLQQEGQSRPVLRSFAAAQEVIPASFERPAIGQSVMIVMPVDAPDMPTASVDIVGSTCRVCTVSDCEVRREPSVWGASSSAETA